MDRVNRRISWVDIQEVFSEEIPRVRSRSLVSLNDALGMVSAESVASPIDIPGFDRSLVDGYAVRGAPPWRLREEKSLIGKSEDLSLDEKEAIYVSTGGIVPRHAEYVIKVENTEVENGLVMGETREKHIERRGSDISKGEVLIGKGEVIQVHHLVALSACGVPTVWAYRKPRVTIIITGHEIKPPGVPIKDGEVYDSTGVLLKNLIQELGGYVTEVIRTGEDLDSIRTAIATSMGTNDLIVTTGGTSMGIEDNVSKVVERLGKLIFHGIDVRPGKPMLFGKIEDIPVLGFPGFVTSTLVMANILLPSVLSILRGQGKFEPPSFSVRLGRDVRGFPGWYRILTGILRDGEFWPTFKTSAAVSSFTSARGYIVLNKETDKLDKGELVSYHPFLGY